jgi:multidrug efflux system outer membrane protein
MTSTRTTLGAPRLASETWVRRTLALLTLSLLTTGCNVGPKYTRPQVPAPPAFRGADNADVSTDPKTSIADQQWSTIFHEPELQDLIRTALQNNYDLRIAAQHILEQAQQVRITRSQEFPLITVGGTAIGADIPSLNNYNNGNNNNNNSGFNLSSPIVEGSFALSASWTPDFWGLYRKQTEAQRDQLLAQEWAQRAVRVTLVQQVATAYFQLRALDAQLAISQDTLKARQDSLNLTQTLETGGAAPLSDVRQAEQLLYTATSEIPQLKQQIQQTENALRLLLGQTPGTVAHADPAALAPPPTDLPTGIPSQLLARRPDIEQAEAQLMAANANVGVARAQFFPQLSISASAGVGGNSFSQIFTTDSHTIYGLGQLAQPIFAGGKLRGQLELSKAQKEEMILSYQKTILGAFRDVSNALIAAQKTREARIEDEKLVASAKDATRLARVRYQGGAASYIEVLTNDTNYFNAQLSLVTAQQNEALTLVQLYSALGGGWQ